MGIVQGSAESGNFIFFNHESMLAVLSLMIILLISCSPDGASKTGEPISYVSGDGYKDKQISEALSNQQSDSSRYEKLQNETVRKMAEIKADQQILLSEAKKEKLIISDEEVEDYIKKGMASYNLTEDDLKQKVQEAGISYEQYKDSLKENIAVSQLISQNVNLTAVTVSDEEVSAYIEERKDELGDLIEDENAMAPLRAKLKMKLTKDKQLSLVHEYASGLG